MKKKRIKGHNAFSIMDLKVGEGAYIYSDNLFIVGRDLYIPLFTEIYFEGEIPEGTPYLYLVRVSEKLSFEIDFSDNFFEEVELPVFTPPKGVTGRGYVIFPIENFGYTVNIQKSKNIPLVLAEETEEIFKIGGDAHHDYLKSLSTKELKEELRNAVRYEEYETAEVVKKILHERGVKTDFI